MSGVTTCLRFPGQLNADLRKLAVNMVSRQQSRQQFRQLENKLSPISKLVQLYSKLVLKLANGIFRR